LSSNRSDTQRDFWTARRLLDGSSASFAVFAGFVSLAFLTHGFPGQAAGIFAAG
jgi:hypothetical protein